LDEYEVNLLEKIAVGSDLLDVVDAQYLMSNQQASIQKMHAPQC